MYQQNNSVLSIASGKLYGKLLDGSTTARNYTSVDVRESDFIWTPISEEFGFIGCMVVLALLSIIIIKCFLAAKNARDYMGMMIAVGIGAMFCFQTFSSKISGSIHPGLQKVLDKCCSVDRRRTVLPNRFDMTFRSVSLMRCKSIFRHDLIIFCH